MLQVELDVFSGMPNPTWVLSERQEATLYEMLAAAPSQVSRVAEEVELGLGYRGLIVRHVKPDEGVWSKALQEGDIPFADEFRVGVRPAERDAAADWLVRTAAEQGVRWDDEVQEVVSRGPAIVPPTRGPRDPSARIDDDRVERAETPVDEPYQLDAEHHETWWACPSNCFLPNAAFFNEPAHVGRNNCYCFGSNHRPDIRYALPGKRGGRPARWMSCDEVVAGLRADGWKDGCQPNGLTIAMVIWPGQDYHFYRLVTGGPYWWWGHKRGGTPARYTDECGHPIYQFQGKGYAPNNICRADYKDFCGYFYQNNATALVA